MTCDEFWKEMPELAGAEDAPGHASECPACAALLERHRSIAEGLAQIAKNSVALQASAGLESRLVEAFRNRASSRPPAPWRYWMPWAAAAAAALLVVLSLAWIRGRQPQRAEQVSSNVQVAAADFAAEDSGFVPLPYGAADLAASDPGDDADLVRVEVPRSALVALGVPVPVDTPARVEAVVALGPDGMLQGIRVLQ